MTNATKLFIAKMDSHADRSTPLDTRVRIVKRLVEFAPQAGIREAIEASPTLLKTLTLTVLENLMHMSEDELQNFFQGCKAQMKQDNDLISLVAKGVFTLELQTKLEAALIR